MKNGRPTKLTPETGEQIIKAISMGATYRDAAESSGVWYETFNTWMKKGEDEDGGVLHKFNLAVRHAQAEARLKLTMVVVKAAKDGEWRAAIEYLKRHDRAAWGDAVDVTSDGKPLPQAAIIYIPTNGRNDDDRNPPTT